MESALRIYEDHIRGLPLQEQLDLLALLARGLSRKQPRKIEDVSAEELAAADAALFRFCGIYNSGDPRSGDNDRIDRDLARAYGGSTGSQ